MEKVSIIVPIYNVEKYLEKCIESILGQTYTNIEVILVNDGSPDNCAEICDRYAKKDKRIKVIHKQNGGISDARNTGNSMATGEWITHIDSDDFVEKNFVEYLMKIVKEHDAQIGIVLPMKLYEDYKYKKDLKKEKIYEFDGTTAVKEMLYQKKFDTSVWGKIYHKSIISDILFPNGKIYEDMGTVYKYLLKANKVVFSTKKIYYYLQRSTSIMGTPFRPRDLDYVYQAEKMIKDIKKVNNYELDTAAECRYLNTNFSILLKIKKSKEGQKYKKELLENIKKFRKKHFFNKNTRIKTKIGILLSYIKYFG